MDIQLYVTEEELKELPEDQTDKTDLDSVSKPKDILLPTSDLPRSSTDLPKPLANLPSSAAKARHQCKARRCQNCN